MGRNCGFRGREHQDLVAAAGDDLVHALELRMAFDAFALRVEQVESVVGADPEERVARHGDLLDEVARQPVAFLPCRGKELHAFAVPHVQAVAGSHPQIAEFVLPERQDGVVRDAFAAGDLSQIAGLERPGEQDGQQRDAEMRFHRFGWGRSFSFPQRRSAPCAVSSAGCAALAGRLRSGSGDLRRGPAGAPEFESAGAERQVWFSAILGKNLYIS